MTTVARAEAPVTADVIIGKTIARNQQSEARPPQEAMTYTKVSVTEQVDATGKVRDHKEKVYQMSLRGGTSFRQLLQVNGRPPSEADLKKQAENESRLRRVIGDGNAGNKGFLTPEIAARFDFTLMDTTTLNGRQTYVLAFEPKSPAPTVRRTVDRLLDRLSGRLWIDADEFEIARAEVRLRSEVDLLGGVAGCLRKLAYTVTRTRVADGVWLDTDTSGDFEGRKLLDSLHIKTHTQSSNFQPVT